MGSFIKIKHKGGISILEVDFPIKLKAIGGEIKYKESQWRNDSSSLVKETGKHKIFKFKGI